MKVFQQASFTRFKTLDKLKNAFKQAPKQVAGSPDAYNGLVAEFADPSTEKTYTCSEIEESFRCNKFLVKMFDGRVITISRDNGKFVIKE
jgi:hypothetical protein